MLCNVKPKPSHLPFPDTNNLCLDVESTWEALHVVGKRALVLEELDVGTVWLEVALAALGDVLLTVERGEAPLLADDLRQVRCVLKEICWCELTIFWRPGNLY